MTMVAEAKGIELQEGDRLVAYANGEQVGEVTVINDDTADHAKLLTVESPSS